VSVPPSLFQRHIGIDYSGAGTPDSRLTGIRVFEGAPLIDPFEVRFRHHWSRRELTEWLLQGINAGIPALIGIDHGFSFPLAYFEKYNLKRSWPDFLIDFCTHWPTAARSARVADLRNTSGKARSGNSRWKRLCECRAGSAKSVFHFGVPGSVAHSTHAGLPWLAHLRAASKSPVHFWPFDGWTPPPGVTVIAEIYPSLWKSLYHHRPGLTPDQQDACTTASWLLEADLTGLLKQAFHPALTPTERRQAQIEGWILGVP
jgi:hypothetical protein